MSRDRFGKVILIGAVAISWAILAFMTYTWLVPKQMNFDFFDRWYGARVMLDGEDPYTLDVNRRILEEKGYTGPFIPYWHSFGYPATITYILLPLVILPFPIAVSIWCGLQLLIFMTLGAIIAHLFRWRLRPALLIALAVAGVAQRHSLNTYVLGQFTAFATACVVLAVWLIDEDHPWLAGACLVGATVRPEGILFAAFILLDLLLARKIKIILAWAAMMGTLLALSLLQIGFWIPDFLRYTSEYGQRFVSIYPPEVIGNTALERILVIAVVSWGIWMLKQMRSLPDRPRLLWSLSVLILIVLLVMRQSKDYTLVYVLVPTYVVMAACYRQRWIVLAGFFLLLSSWLYNALQWNMGHDFPLEQLLTPLITAMLLTYGWLSWKEHFRTTPTLAYATREPIQALPEA